MTTTPSATPVSPATSIGFIGAGRIATALATGWVRTGAVAPARISSFDPGEAAQATFLAQVGGQALASAVDVARHADVVIIAVKPRYLAGVLQEVREAISGKLILCVAAGVTFGRIEATLGTDQRLIRVIPNTPTLVGAGASGYAMGARALEADGLLVDQLLSAVGQAFRVDESMLDAFAGLSGSGPAFVYYMIAAFRDIGIQLGLPEEIATNLAAATVRGAGAMVLETRQTPEWLSDQVATVGGTTVGGLRHLDEGNVREYLMGAVEVSTRLAKEQAGG